MVNMSLTNKSYLNDYLCLVVIQNVQAIRVNGSGKPYTP